MAETTDILNDFPELRFPAGRVKALSPREIAEKVGCTTNHIHNLDDQGAFLGTLHLDAPKTRKKGGRRCIRIPMTSYYAWLREILVEGWRPRHRPDPKQPELF